GAFGGLGFYDVGLDCSGAFGGLGFYGVVCVCSGDFVGHVIDDVGNVVGDRSGFSSKNRE
ncbi:MAG: hypothetical protein ABEI31_09235, partial [Halodesulfurarchaeum sp.]